MSADQIIDPLSFVLLRPRQLTQSEVVFTFSLSVDRVLSSAGFWGQSIQQSQTASRRSPHPWRRSSYSWRHNSRPEREDRYGRTNHSILGEVFCGKIITWSKFCLISEQILTRVVMSLGPICMVIFVTLVCLLHRTDKDNCPVGETKNRQQPNETGKDNFSVRYLLEIVCGYLRSSRSLFIWV